SSIQKDLSLTDFQGGLLGTVYVVPYIITAPIYGYIGDQKPRNILLAMGAGVWSVATFLSGLATSFWTLASSRFLLGIGESSFSSVSPAYITDFYPPERHGRVMAIFSAALPVGAALGYVLGGALSGSIGWRNAFFVVGLPGLIMAFLIYRLPDVKNSNREREKWTFDYIMTLIRERPFFWTVLGYCAQTFVLGGLAHWMPTYMQRVQGFDEMKANMVFGGIAVVSGLLGTLIGGRWSDEWERRSGNGYMKLCVLSMALSLPAFALTMMTNNFNVFLVGLFLTEFCFFLSTSPINVMILSSVPEKLRSSAMAFSIFACHFLGDAISTSLIGAVSDSTGSLITGFSVCYPVIVLCVLLWAIPLVIRPHLRPWPETAFKMPDFQSHRGFHREGLPENSTASLVEARRRGAEMAEFDVRLRKDGVVVLAHDPLTGKETEKSLTALQEVLESPDVPKYLNIEIKSTTIFSNGIEKKVADLIVSCKAEKRVLVSSFNFFVLRRMGILLPDLPLAYLIEGKSKRFIKNEWFMSFSKAHVLNVDQNFWYSKLGLGLRRLDVPMAIWTVNTESEIGTLLSEGAKSIISDLAPAKGQA
ncbi:MAG: MFS transporter, partial [Pseudobdellovibrionaceae bacterium]